MIDELKTTTEINESVYELEVTHIHPAMIDGKGMNGNEEYNRCITHVTFA